MKQKLLEAVVKELKIGVVVIDADKNILYANPFFEKTFSTEEPVEGKRITDIINNPEMLNAASKVLSSNKEHPQEITMHGKGNQILEARLVPALDALIGFFHDVTEEKRVEAIKRDFVANVSHELRTPLASIKGYAETLLSGALEDKTSLKKFLAIIDKHANRMTVLIEDLLTLSMLESHQMPMSFAPVEVKNIISGVMQGFEKQARDKGLQLIMDIKEDIPNVSGDKNRLEQVITNLVDNAIKYTNSGSVKISAERQDSMLRIDIKDTGIGIPEKDIPRLFERFYRVDKGRSREVGGTGLGLAIAKHIIQGHNGKILVGSKLGEGTTFSFSLPL